MIIKPPNKALHLTAFPLAPTSPAPSRQVSSGVMRNMKIILITILIFFSKSIFACSCGAGEYYYSMSKLEGELEEASEFYQQNYGVSNLNIIKKVALNPNIEDTFGFMVVTLPIPEEFRGNSFHLVLESKVGLESKIDQGFINKAVFKKIILNPNKEVVELSTRIESKGNEWSLYVLSVNKKGNIVALAKHSGRDTCGRDIYVSSVSRAKELDKKRTSGCFQTWGYE